MNRVKSQKFLTESYRKKIGERLRYLRKSQKFTLEYVATTMRITKQYLSQIEIGVNLPPLDLLIRLSNLYNCSVDFILCKSDKTSEQSGAITTDNTDVEDFVESDIVMFTEADVEKIISDVRREERRSFINDLENMAKTYRRKYNKVLQEDKE